jgi:prevent-host-death family protein
LYKLPTDQVLENRSTGRVNMISISEARSHLAELVEKVNEKQEPYHILSHSRPRAVLMAEDNYNQLLEQLEDLQDSVAILKARPPAEPSRSFVDFARELTTQPAPHV